MKHGCITETPEGTCLYDAYRPQGEQYYNKQTGRWGDLVFEDSEWHFEPR